jgi:hypothetical protein
VRKLIAIAAAAFVLSHGFDSLLRWLFELVHLGALIYARDAIALAAILLGFVDLVAREPDATVPLGALAALIGATAVGVASSLPIEQIGFGIKVWLPLFLGLVTHSSGAIRDLDVPRRWLWVWGTLVMGVLANIFVTYPWAGMVIQVGDTAVTANREWSTGGIARVSGFSRTSFDGAMCIILLAFYLVMTLERRVERITVWLLSGAAIAATTTKATIGVYIAATPMLPLLLTAEAYRPSGLAIRRVVVCSALTLIAAIGLIVPVVTSQIDLPLLQEGSIEHLLFASLVDRAWSTWPEAWSLLSSWQVVLGRGLGGIGAAQFYYEKELASPADNLFVYAYVTGGLAAAAIYVWVAQLCWSLTLTTRVSRLCYCILLFLFVDGLTTNVIECAPALITIGTACAAAIAESARTRRYVTV